MVKALKGDPIKGYFNYKVAGKVRRFNQANVHEFTARIPPALARHIQRHYSDGATLVPIPNSHVTSSGSADFKTYELAKAIAEHSGGKLKVVPALVFKERQRKAREGGPREAKYLEGAYRTVRKVDGPIILIDDVCTGGGHIIAAHRKLDRPESPVVLACTFGRTTKVQHENPIQLRSEVLPL